MLMGAAVCPHPPLLVPDVSGAAAPELDALRGACDAAVATLIAAGPDLIAVVGSVAHVRGTGGTLAAYGVDVRVGTGPPTLPLPHTVGCWLLDRAGWSRRRLFVGAHDDELVATEGGRLALLVMGDASARRTEKAPGYLDARAETHDAMVAAALGSGPAAVAQLDGDLSRELMGAGWPAWQFLARVSADGQWQTAVTYDDAPYGVGYLVAEWTRR
jgi:hypothetical protein